MDTFDWGRSLGGKRATKSGVRLGISDGVLGASGGLGGGTIEAVNSAIFLIGDNATVLNGNDALSQIIDDVFVMGSDEDGSAGIIDTLEEIDNLRLSKDIEIGCRLISDEDFRLSRNGASNRDTLNLAAGEGGGKLFGFIL